MKTNNQINPEYPLILEWVTNRSAVLDLGCGSGELLYTLIKGKKVRGQGIEINEAAIFECVAKGLNVFHGDIDTGLAEYQDKSFDFVILNQTLQQIKHVDSVLTDALRVGKQVIVGFPNFAHYISRIQIFFQGRTPITGALPYQWYETPNLHFLSISDFTGYCKKKNITIEKKAFFSGGKKINLLPNLFANVGLFLIHK